MNKFPVENINKVEEAVSADVASKLATAKNITLTGDVTGTASFDGTEDTSITAVITDDSHSHTIANIDELQATLDTLTNNSSLVTQTVTTTNAIYPILLSATESKTATSTEEARFASTVTVNPSSGSIASKFININNSFETNVAISGTSIDVSTGSVFTKTISAATTFTFTGAVSSKVTTFSLILTNGGSKTVTWPSSVKWADDTVPSLTASGVDVITFMTNNGGTTWYGVSSILNAK